MPEIEGEHLFEVHDQLDMDRLVQAELLPQLRHVLRRRRPGFSGQDIRRVTWRQLQQREVQADDHQDRRHRLQQALERVEKALGGHGRQDSTARPLLGHPGLVE